MDMLNCLYSIKRINMRQVYGLTIYVTSFFSGAASQTLFKCQCPNDAYT